MAIEIKHTDKIASALLLLLAIVVFVATADFPRGPTETGPDFFPRMIVALIAFFALVQLAKSVRSEVPNTHEVSRSVAVTVAIAAALVVGYVAVMPFLGFVLATLLFLVVSMHFSGVETFRHSIPISVVVTIVLYYVFVQFLRVRLPEGVLVDFGQLLPSLWIAGGMFS